MMKRLLALITAAATLGLAGCDLFDGDDAPPAAAQLQVLHASALAPNVNVLIDGDIVVADATYKDATGFGLIAPGTYSVQVDAITPAGDDTVFGPADLTFESGNRYSVVALDAYPVDANFQLIPNASDFLIVSNEITPVAAASARIEIVHAAPEAPAVDVYATAPGADLAASAPIGSFIFGETLGPAEVPADTYQIRVTLANDPSTVVYDAGEVTLAEGADLLIAAVQNTTTGAAPISLLALDGNGATELLDVDTPAELRVVHNSPDAPAVDVIVNDNSAQPLVEDLFFPDFTGYVAVPGDDYNVKVTPANVPGTVVIDADLTLDAGTRYSVLAVDTLANIMPQVLVDDARRVITEANVRIVHGSPSAGNVDIFVTAPGTDITTVDPAFSDVAFMAETGFVPLAPGDYDVTVTPTGTTTAAIGPLTVSLGEAGIYTAIARDPLPGQTDLGLILLDDFSN